MSLFIHRYLPSPIGSDMTLLGLHGTGSNEEQVLELLRILAPEAAMLAPRGRSTEEGINRFFRRFSEGVFDVADIKARALELAEWIAWARKEYGIGRLVAVGYSNGANIGTATLFADAESIDGFVCLRGMTPYEPETLDLGGKPVLMINGEDDPIMDGEDVERLAAIYRSAGADLEFRRIPGGHQLTRADFPLARHWLGEHGFA